ncbi:protein SMG9 [Stomoxys calcitrans]|uniref:KAP NTPase domain-containing protein n=1 Tax=Stomoxys calcitrans TaxID=35570 RepID=A0A1I8NPK6_STOCA|nr:protein SMG9 [Stomoxys calcitrans]
MSDRRRRYRKPKDEKPVVQPKILLKSNKPDKHDSDSTPSSSSYSRNSEHSTSNSQVPHKTIIFQKSNTQSPTMSPNVARDQQHSNIAASASASSSETTSNPSVETVYQMSRPATVISSTGTINVGTKKLLMKTNTDFLVVGVVGTQGVGKSTILNLLANELHDFDYYRKVFVEEDSTFPTKLKIAKCSARSRTESTHLFITSDRMILLDTPPVMSNAYKKDMITNELEDLDSVIMLMSVCHLIIVVQDDYFNLSFLNLIRFAELMKPSQDVKPFLHDYFPNVLFVKNRAKRLDFTPASQACQEQMLRAFFKDSKLRIFKGQTSEAFIMPTQQQQVSQKNKKNRGTDVDREVNMFLFPEIKSETATTFHASLLDIVKKFRTEVFTTPRNPMHVGPTELNEEMWFDWLTKVSQDNHNFFFNTYEDIQRKHLDAAANEKGNIGAGTSNSNSFKDEIW